MKRLIDKGKGNECCNGYVLSVLTKKRIFYQFWLQIESGHPYERYNITKTETMIVTRMSKTETYGN